MTTREEHKLAIQNVLKWMTDSWLEEHVEVSDYRDPGKGADQLVEDLWFDLFYDPVCKACEEALDACEDKISDSE